MKKRILIVVCLYISSCLYSQGKKNLPNSGYKWAFELNGFASRIIKHSANFKPEIPPISYAFELSASTKTFGDKNWHRALNYPEVGLSYVQTHFGDGAILGNAYGLAPFVKYNISRNKILDFHAKLAAGLAYLNKRFDPVENPTNNVIGSRINTIVQFRMGLDFHLNKSIDLQLAATFMHYSNASVQAPNLGINIPSINLGLLYRPAFKEKEFIAIQDSNISIKKNEYTVKLSVGLTQKFARGAKLPVYSLALQYGRSFGYANKILAGALLAFEQYEYDFLLIRELDEDKNQTARALDWSVYLGYEMILGKVGLSFILGKYIYNPSFSGPPIWAKPGVTYYFPGLGKKKHLPFLGVNMKTHYFTAQYVEINFGIGF